MRRVEEILDVSCRHHVSALHISHGVPKCDFIFTVVTKKAVQPVSSIEPVQESLVPFYKQARLGGS